MSAFLIWLLAVIYQRQNRDRTVYSIQDMIVSVGVASAAAEHTQYHINGLTMLML